MRHNPKTASEITAFVVVMAIAALIVIVIRAGLG